MNQVLELFWLFFKIGLFTIGGGYAMVPLIKSEIVGHGLLTMTEVTDFLAISEMAPGPFAVNIATYIGTELNGFWGALLSTIGVILPSFIITLIAAKYFEKFKTNRIIKGAIKGLRPVVIGLIIASLLIIAKEGFLRGTNFISVKSFFINNISYASIFILIISFILIKKYKLHPILVIVVSAGLGILLKGVLPLITGINVI